MKTRIYFLFILLLLFPVACGEEEVFDLSASEPDQRETSLSDSDETLESDVITNTPIPIIDKSDDASAQLDDYMMQMVEDDTIPGAAIVVVSGDEVLFINGYGFRDIEANLPVTDETLFHIGSVNKSFTGLLVATLVDDGILAWDSRAIDIYPDFALTDQTSAETVTIRHLLSMRSGIPDWAEDDLDLDEVTADDIILWVASAELDGEPGEQFSYSNVSSSIAGYLGVIASTGSDEDVYDGYVKLLTEHVLRPIGMQTARVNVSDLLDNPNYGKSYILSNGEPVEADPADYDGDPLAPSGIIKANIREMGLYVQTQLNEGVAPSGERVVSAENITETWQPYLNDYGMGWENHNIGGVDIIMHEGAYDNYLSVAGFAPEQDLGFVILINSEDAGGNLLDNAPSKIIELFAE
ncbi:MAG: serine hydrolase domain-containing protein [Candidatus Promineifilaceae bacterium]